MFRIPNTKNAAKKKAAEVDQKQITAGWEKAALCYAWTKPKGPDTGDTRDPSGLLSITEAAKMFDWSPKTVEVYRRVWRDHGPDLSITPGSPVKLPTEPWEGLANYQRRSVKSGGGVKEGHRASRSARQRARTTATLKADPVIAVANAVSALRAAADVVTDAPLTPEQELEVSALRDEVEQLLDHITGTKKSWLKSLMH